MGEEKRAERDRIATTRLSENYLHAIVCAPSSLRNSSSSSVRGSAKIRRGMEFAAEKHASKETGVRKARNVSNNCDLRFHSRAKQSAASLFQCVTPKN